MPDATATRRSGHIPRPRLQFRPTLGLRLTAVLSATAALSAALAMILHDRTLTADLERAAEERLARATTSARRLVEDHLATLGERYRAISSTPELRASLEVGHAPTLAFYAETLRAREHPALIAFLDRENRVLAMAGREELVGLVRSAEAPSLVAHRGRAYAIVFADIETPSGPAGRLAVAEPLRAQTLHHWSELCGATVGLARPGVRLPDMLARPAQSLGALDLVVSASLESESAALRRSRASLIAAGTLAVTLSLIACVLLARGFVQPIVAIQHAAERIRRGDLGLRLHSERRDEIGDVARAFDLMLDGWVESRHEIERRVGELRRSRQHLANAQKLARLGSFELELEKGRPSALRASEELRQLLQIEDGDASIDVGDLLRRVAPEDREGLSSALSEVIEGGMPLRTDVRLGLPDGERIVRLEARVTRDEHRDAPMLEGTVQDVTDRRRADEQIRYLAHHDSLTGLGNRLLFAERLELAIAQARRRSTEVGVLYVDLDAFKRVNDTLGPSIGDEVLRQVADRLVGALRGTDFVGRDVGTEHAISRLAGDEFTLLLNDLGNAKDLAFVASRMLFQLSRPLDVRGQEVVLNASIGIATWPNDGEDVDALLTNASSAMRHAKQRGGNRYEFYDESMRQMGTQMLELEARIRHGIAAGEFEMHYQPKVSLANGRVVGFEALMRWRDPERGLLQPRAFIPVAEHCGLIQPLGDLALAHSCRQLARWQRELAAKDVPSVAVNLSPNQFKVGGVVDSVARILDESGARADRLEVEITESAMMHDEKGVIADLEQLRELGISIALDDFGTGQSSLSYLRRLPVDTLKVDMSFVRNIEHSPEDASLTAAIVALGRARGLRVVAEGVETEGQRRLLEGWDCNEIQGFLISPALPADEAIRLARPAPSDTDG